MDAFLSAKHRLYRRFFRDFAVSELAPRATETDASAEYPAEALRRMAEHGFFGLPFPRAQGGIGADYLAYILAAEEFSRECAATGGAFTSHTALVSCPIFYFGTPAQHERWLKPLIAQGKMGSFCLTEPDAGTDVGGIRCRAEKDNGGYILNGSKIFITSGLYAQTYIVFAATGPGRGTRGLTAFLVDKDTPGFRFGRLEDKMGIRASSAAVLFFDDVRIPAEQRLGAEGQGYAIAMHTLDGGRIGIAAQATGIARAAYDAAAAYLGRRRQFRRPLSEFQGLRWSLADMLTQCEAAQLLVYRAARDKALGRPVTRQAAQAKLFASETATRCAHAAQQMHGGYGYMKGTAVERLYRDARITEIYEGTSEAQRMIIAADALKRQENRG